MTLWAPTRMFWRCPTAKILNCTGSEYPAGIDTPFGLYPIPCKKAGIQMDAGLTYWIYRACCWACLIFFSMATTMGTARIRVSTSATACTAATP